MVMLNEKTNPIETAVAPLKNDAIARAEKYAQEVVAHVQADIEKCGSLDAAAPLPHAWQAPTATREQYKAAQRKRDLYKSLRSADGVAKFLKDAKDNAAFQYEAFVAKLVSKIGEVKTAKLKGNHVWGESFLTVVTAAGETHIWKTQTIINVSKLGKVFNQFPTRKVKAAY